MKWFGRSWDAPMCVEGEQIDLPEGAVCGYCEESIEEGSRGVMLPYVGPTDTLVCVLRGDQLEKLEGAWMAQHLECFLRTTLGSVGHVEGRCSCVGGDEEDPPGLSRREAAIAAVAAFERKHGKSVT